MPCYHPLTGYRAKEPGPSGKRRLVFDRRAGHPALPPVTVPCGQCIGCRVERSRQWALRCIHEASLHEENCFITLTYDDEHLPPDGSVNVEHFQKFMKRLRKAYSPKTIRFFHCGEYGDLNKRPHYHALLFGHDFEDKNHWKTVKENKLFTSQALSSLWPAGFSSLGLVTYQSAAYVARYVLKKRSGPPAQMHYTNFDPETGEIIGLRRPEYVTMSRGGRTGKGGIASDWYAKYKSDCFPSDFLTQNGSKLRVPKFYDQQLEKEDPELLKKLKFRRSDNAKIYDQHNTSPRRKVREKIAERRQADNPRKL